MQQQQQQQAATQFNDTNDVQPARQINKQKVIAAAAAVFDQYN